MPHRRAQRILASVLVVCALVGTAACTDDDDPASSTRTTAAPPTVPADCAGFVPGASTTSSVPDRCLDAVFAQTLARGGSTEVKQVGNTRLVSLGRSLCEYARALGAAKQEPPTYREFLDATAKSWDVGPVAVDEIATAAKVLCPDEIQVVTAMKAARGPVDVKLRVDGKGKADITFTSADGATQRRDAATTPWTETLQLLSGIEITVTVQSSDRLTCSVAIGKEVLVKHRTDDGGRAVCTVTAAEIDRATLQR